jgi:hypothetical protein
VQKQAARQLAHNHTTIMIREILNCCGGASGRQKAIAATSPPRRGQLKAAAQETYDRLWSARHVGLGRPAAGEKSALQIETKYGAASLVICECCELRLEGRLGALRWALYGSALDNYDT